LKPDSQKSYLEQAKVSHPITVRILGCADWQDTVVGKTDSAASTAQPDSQKTWTQSAGDALSGNQNQNSGGIIDQAKVCLTSISDGHSLTSQDALGMNNNNAANTNKNL
jgi:hypothetical protein